MNTIILQLCSYIAKEKQTKSKIKLNKIKKKTGKETN